MGLNGLSFCHAVTQTLLKWIFYLKNSARNMKTHNWNTILNSSFNTVKKKKTLLRIISHVATRFDVKLYLLQQSFLKQCVVLLFQEAPYRTLRSISRQVWGYTLRCQLLFCFILKANFVIEGELISKSV